MGLRLRAFTLSLGITVLLLSSLFLGAYTSSVQASGRTPISSESGHRQAADEGGLSAGQAVLRRSQGISETYFVETTVAAGITSTHAGGNFVTGQAWGDYNGDGYLDLYLTDSGGPNTLYLNNQDGTFTVSPLAAQVSLPAAVSGGATWADYNNDGWRDLFVANWGSNTLFRNDGGAGFTDVTDEAGVGDIGSGVNGAWGDYDQDGWLDLYVINHVACDNPGEPGCNWDDILYHNNGDGTFSDVTAALVAGYEGPGLAGSWLDYDNDGDLDFYLVNDKMRGGLGGPPGSNILWRNDGPGCADWCFSDVTAATNSGAQVDGMGLGVGDYDNDGDLDLYFSDSGPAILLQNQISQGSESFVDVTVEAGVYHDRTCWAALMFDFDNDGLLDMYLAVSDSDPAWTNRLWHNLGENEAGIVTFEDKTAEGGALALGFSTGAAYADYDNDGFQDLVVGNWRERYFLYHNEGIVGAANDWLTINLVGAGPINRDAIGSRVYVHFANGLTTMQEVKSGSSFGAGNDLALHIGLGSAADGAQVDRIEVVWSDGLRETFTEFPLNQIWTLTYPSPTDTTLSSFAGNGSGRLGLLLLVLFLFLVLVFVFVLQAALGYRIARRER